LKTNILQKDNPNVSRNCMCLWCQQCQFKLKTNILQKDDRQIGSRDCQSDLHLRASKISLLSGEKWILFYPFPICIHNVLPRKKHVPKPVSEFVSSHSHSRDRRISSLPSVVGRAATLLAFISYATLRQRFFAASSLRRAQLSAACCSLPRAARSPIT
jgi:hypothetical protein